MISYLPSSSDISPVPPAPLEPPPQREEGGGSETKENDGGKEGSWRGEEEDGVIKEELIQYADNLIENVVAEVCPFSGNFGGCKKEVGK